MDKEMILEFGHWLVDNYAVAILQKYSEDETIDLSEYLDEFLSENGYD